MATRGYLKLVNPERNSEDPYYGTKEDILVEAYHDGYTYDMVMDIVKIAPRMLALNRAGFGHFFFKDGHNGLTDGRDTLEQLIDTCECILVPCTVDFMGILDLLQFTKPHKYHILFPGATRYDSPIEDDSVSVIVNVDHDTHRYGGDFELKIQPWEGGDDKAYRRQLYRTLRRDIKKVNTELGLTKYPFTIHRGRVRGSIISAFIEGFHNSRTKK